ncbi:ATP-binding protein [Actinoplanes sp. CA-252034]|uniref:ATP-binding protein n=1 Tax=Actinoplanes sp. CA-252034 TaxID=3239906 RepID=UPI003D987BD4
MTSECADELLYDSDRTRVSRVRLADGNRVVRKQPLGAGAADRLRNEIAVLRRLESVSGTPTLAGDGATGVLELVDTGARTLADLDSPWATDALLDLGLDLAEILAGIHRCGVVHRDVSPANVLVDVATNKPMLIDFELARLSGADTAHGRSGGGKGDGKSDEKSAGLVGTLPYLAPEQSGRTGCPVDHRSDLYSLGATLYELATGRPPFGRDRDPLSLLHDHLAAVPDAPSEVNPLVPALLSQIILRLLSKEPELRYQSGEGLAHDLAQLRAGRLTVLGERDFPIRLAPPARLVGREAPLAALHALLGDARDSSALALVTGPPGVGKTALVDRLRPAVAAAGGRFVSGKFDQFHHDAGGGAVREAFDRLGEQLLAEPEDVVARLRTRLREALGADAGLIAALMPSFRALLDVAPQLDVDPRVFLARLRRAGMALLRTVGDGAPLVFFLDDLQWATGAAFSYLDDVLDDPDVPGLLVLGAYREEEVDEAHPLTAVRARLHRERGDAGEVRLDNLSVADLGVLIAGMLHLPEAERLAAVLADRTRGNPFDTVELLNALRREGVLVPDGGGWRWDATAVRDFVGHGDVVALLTARIVALPADTRAAVDLMACLHGEVPLDLLDAPLTAAVDDGLVVIDGGSARFRHDRVQQAAFGRLSADERARLSLSLARRLAPAPDAAPLYLAAADVLLAPGAAAPGERRTAATLLRTAAAAARLVANHASAEAHLAVAVRLLDKTEEGYGETRAAWHAALCAVGRFADADRLFADLAATVDDPVRLARPVAEQLGALTNRRMLNEALELGLGLLSRLGIDVPSGPAEMGPRIGAGMATFYGWLATAGDGDLPEITDPRILAAAHVIDRLCPAAFFADRMTLAWLVAQAAELWAGHGVCAALTGTLGNIGIVTIAGSGDHEAAYRATSHVLAAGAGHGHEPATSQVKFLHALATVPWCEPLENAVRMAHEARDGLLRAGDLRTAFYSYFASLPQMLDLSADLEPFLREVRSAEAFAERIGTGHDAAVFAIADMMVRTLRGTGDFDDAVLEPLKDNDTAYAFATTMRTLLAAVLGDDESLVRFSAESMRALPAVPGSYLNAPVHLLAVLAAAVTARAGGADREQALVALDRSRDFLAARAAGQPGNFRHLYRLAEATRAAVHGDFAGAAAAYDEAMSDAATAGRSWHTPLITELAARFYLDNGLQHVGDRLLAEALPGYARWGATGKVQALKRAHPALGSALGSPAPAGRPRSAAPASTCRRR